MKKRIFIGSSAEELKTANIVKGLLNDDFEVIIWNENLWDKSVFKLNSNFLQDLLKAPLKFDYAILIGTPDDKVEVRGKEFLQARDNILFELGLFIGRLGLEKCAFLVEENVKNLSDLEGVFLSKFNKSNLPDKVNEIKCHFLLDKDRKFNFFPSNTLAYGYFENFIKPICEAYFKENKFEIDGKFYENCILKLIIPNELLGNINLQYQSLKNEIGVEDKQVISLGRPRTYCIDIKKFGEDTLVILDFPTTLTGINYAIRELLPEEYADNGEEYKIILSRELNRFVSTLQNLINREGFDKFVLIERK